MQLHSLPEFGDTVVVVGGVTVVVRFASGSFGIGL